MSVLEELKQAIVEGEDDVALEKAKAALNDKVPPLEILNQAIVPGIEKAGQLWSDNRYFMPDVILSAGAFKAALEEVEPHLATEKESTAKKVMVGVVEGDMHDLGKTILTAMLSGAGFEVIDLGVDVPVQTFVEKTKEFKPDIVGLGAYMTTTMLLMKDVVDALSDEYLRDQVKVMVGGVPTTQEFADEIGADAWGKDAIDAVDKARQLLEVK